MRQRVLMLAFIVLSITTGIAPAAEFFGIGDFPGGIFDSRPRAISADGRVIVGLGNDAGGEEIFRWTRETGMVELFPSTEGETFGHVVSGSQFFLPVASRDGTAVAALSDEGVVYYSDTTGRVVNSAVPSSSFPSQPLISADGSTIVGGEDLELNYRWRIGRELEVLPLSPMAISEDASVVGGFIGLRPAIWSTDGGLIELDPLPGFRNSLIVELSADGKVALGLARPGPGERPFRPFLWTEQTGVTMLGDFPVAFARPQITAVLLTGDGEVAFGWGSDPHSRDPDQFFRWTEKGGYELFELPAGFADFQDIRSVIALTDDASRVTGDARGRDFEGDPLERRGWIWQEGQGIRWLDDVLSEDYGLGDQLAGWTNLRNTLISADGSTLTGYGTNPNGFLETWVAILRDAVALPGDYNNNGIIEQGDLGLVLLHWGTNAAAAPPAWTNDLPTGAIDQDELDNVLLGWGSTAATGGATTTAIPEPTAIALCLIAALSYGVGILFSRRDQWLHNTRADHPPQKKNPDPFARLLTSALIVLSIVTSRAAAAEFFGIGEPLAGFEALSADGSTIVGRLRDAVDNSPREAFRWTRDAGIQRLGDLPGGEFRSAASDVSADGRVIVGSSIVQGILSGSFVSDVFRWTAETGMTGIGAEATGRAQSASISANGSTIAFTIQGERALVRWTASDGVQSFRTPDVFLNARVKLSPMGEKIIGPSGLFWSEDGGLTMLSDLIGRPEAQGVSFYDGGKGMLVNATDSTLLWHEDAGVTQLPVDSIFPAPRHVHGDFVSEDGSVVAGFADFDPGLLPWVWHADSGLQFVPIPVEIDAMRPRAMSADGDTLLLSARRDFPGFSEVDGYIWDNTNGLRLLQDAFASEYALGDQVSGWEFDGRRYAISDDGLALVGLGRNPKGEAEVWIADLRDSPPPLPGDYNDNGLVEQGDLDLVLLHWGANAAAAPPAWTNDLPAGAIDQDELDKVLLGWGNFAANVGATTTAVPEPTAIALCLIVALSYGVGILFSRRESASVRGCVSVAAKKESRPLGYAKLPRLNGQYYRGALVISLAIVWMVLPAPAAEFIPLGDLPGGEISSGVRGLSQNGEVVIGRSRTDNGPETYMWTKPTGMMHIPGLPPDQMPNGAFNAFSIASPLKFNVSDDGTSILTTAPAGGRGVFTWSTEHGTRQLTDHMFDGDPVFLLSADGSSVIGKLGQEVMRWRPDVSEAGLTTVFSDPRTIFVRTVSDDGNAIGGGFGTNSEELNPAYVWQESRGLRELSFVRSGHNRAQVTHFSSDGTHAVGTSGVFREPSLFQDDLFLWSEENGVRALSSPADFSGFTSWRMAPWEVTPSLSHVVGGVFVKGTDGQFSLPFIWSEQTGFELVELPESMMGRQVASENHLMDISDDGRRIIGRGANERLFLMDETLGTRWLEDILANDFDLANEIEGWTLRSIGAMSADGNIIAGQGTNPAGSLEAWVAILDDISVRLPGDYNNNGLVEQGDLDLVLLHWGANAAAAPPAWTNDLPTGAIDQDELDKVLLGWGSSSANVGATTTAVPEPAAIALCLIAALSYGVGILFSRREKRLHDTRADWPLRKKNPDPFVPPNGKD